MIIKNLIAVSLLTIASSSNQNIYAQRTSFGRTPRSYTKKSTNEGFGKPSKVNRLPKTKTISSHTKRTSKGYVHVNPYARSK